jgi:hypothetical protein
MYRGINWDLNYSYTTEYMYNTGSWPCDGLNNPWSIYETIPVNRGYCNTTRNVVVDKFTGEQTQTQNISEKVENYYNWTGYDWIIYDRCGGVFADFNTSQWWTVEEITGSCGYKIYDFPGGYTDIYNNPFTGYRTTDMEIYHSSPGILLQSDMVYVPNCSNNLPTFVSLVNWWNSAASSFHYNAGTGSGIVIPTVSIGGFSATDSYPMGWPDNGSSGTCSYDSPDSGSTYDIVDISPYVSSCSVSITRNSMSYDFSVSINAYTENSCVLGFVHNTYAYNGTVALSDTYTSVELQTDLDNLLNNWNMVDNDVYPFRTDGYVNVAPLLTYNELAPTQPNNYVYQCTVDDLRSPKNDVNGNIPFSLSSSVGQKGPAIYDGSGNPPFSPCWTPTYDTPADWIPTWNPTPWFDPNIKCFYWAGTGSVDVIQATGTASLYDGSVLGKPSVIPASVSSSQVIITGNWDWRHPVWDYNQCAITMTGYYWYIKGYGEVNTGQYGIPLTATQWSDYHTSTLFPAYASNFNVGSIGYKQKWAEAKQVWPSWDFNRPYGNDRFDVDQTACSCETDYTTTPGDAIIYAYQPGGVFLNPTPAPSTSDIWGGTDLNGFYTITAVSGDGVSTPWSLTTGSLVLPLPSGFTETFCRLRWPGCPAFGTTPITVASNGYTSSVIFNSPQQQYLSSSVVDFYTSTINPQGVIVPSQSPMTSGSNITIKYIDDYHASCSGDFRSALYLISSGSKTWWCDNQPKGQVVTLQWQRDNRTNGELARLNLVSDCGGNILTGSLVANYGFSSFIPTQVSLISASIDGIPTNNCDTDCQAPGVICFSNNGENFNDRSITYSIPTVSYDLVYNGMWQGEVVQNQQTFDFQVPHKICGVDPSFVFVSSDDGTCKPLDDTSNPPYVFQFYGFPWQVEPFLSLPHTTLLNGADDIAPNPYSSSGHFVWWVSTPVTSSTGIQPPWNSGYNIGGTPKQSLMPWNLKTNVCASTCSLYDYSWFPC